MSRQAVLAGRRGGGSRHGNRVTQADTGYGRKVHVPLAPWMPPPGSYLTFHQTLLE
jgi:hypothetical protein